MAAFGMLAGAVHAQETTASSEVFVQSGRLAQKQFDAPASVRVIDGESIRNAGAQVNLSEAFAQAPGVVALNRNNYAQDVQISIRGFGARAPFGLRGIRERLTSLGGRLDLSPVTPQGTRLTLRAPLLPAAADEHPNLHRSAHP